MTRASVATPSDCSASRAPLTTSQSDLLPIRMATWTIEGATPVPVKTVLPARRPKLAPETRRPGQGQPRGVQRAFFRSAYRDGDASWDVPFPQPAFVTLAARGEVEGPVLDLGCGTGEAGLFF